MTELEYMGTFKRFYREAKPILVDIFNYTRDMTPADTADLLVDRLGRDAADELVAAMVVAKGDWDSRIWPEVRAKAEDMILPYTENDLFRADIYYCDEIHPVHMNQLARALWEM